MSPKTSLNSPWHDSIVVDEIFGPIMPILVVDNIESAIRTANSVHSTPLGLYAFGSKAETNKSKFQAPFCTFIRTPAPFYFYLYILLLES
jgi:acyl-CoA reductase-like NAD-dependent aldehyde dehydrogenase